MGRLVGERVEGRSGAAQESVLFARKLGQLRIQREKGSVLTLKERRNLFQHL